VPASTGKKKRGPKIFFATIGVPFANVNSANNCSMCKKCILAGYLSPARCGTPRRPSMPRRSMKAQEICQGLAETNFAHSDPARNTNGAMDRPPKED
jgi:hypothetical protein